MESTTDQMNSVENSLMENLSISDELPSQVVQQSTTPDTDSRVYRPVTVHASTSQKNMVQVVPEDHPLADDFKRLQQELMEHHPDFSTSESALGHRLMPALDSTDKFLYSQLEPQEIRLIALHPGYGAQDLVCSLTTLQLEVARYNEYEAVSYAWGAPGELYPVRCNNSRQIQTPEGKAYMTFPLDSNHSINVSRNLRDALLRLRVTDDFRMLWIDAICINQEDLQERSEQVQLMADIYASADNVIIWLGEEDEETPRAFECAAQIIEMRSKLSEQYPNPDELPIGVPLWSFPEESPFHISEESWRALCRLFTKRSWFRRVWIIQEVVMAAEATVLCGGYAMAWSRLYEACGIISTFRMCNYDQALVVLGVSGSETNGSHDSAVIIQQALRMGRMRNVKLALEQGEHNLETLSTYQRTFRLEGMVAKVRSAEATDPKDKVYGLWSMAVGRDLLPPVDYTRSVRQVFVAVATYWITNSIHIPANLSWFFSCIQMANPLHHLPSWVPDWSVPDAAPSLFDEGDFCASGDTTAEMKFVGAVPKTGPAFSPSEQWFLEFKQLQRLPPTDFFPKRDEKVSTGDGDCLAAKGIRVFKIVAAERRRTLSYKCSHAEKISRFNDPYPMTSKSYLEVYPLVMNPLKPEDFRCDIRSGDSGLWQYKEKFERQDVDRKSVPEAQTAGFTHRKACQ